MAKNNKHVRRKTAKVSSAPQSSAEETKRKTVCFDYIKSNCFRVIHVDGVHGSPTPRADGIQVAFFSERNPIPQREEYGLTQKGRLGDRIDMKTRSAVVREVEVEAILSLEMAKQLKGWLDEKIRQIEKLRGKGANNGR
jgi:hypothetical protein